MVIQYILNNPQTNPYEEIDLVPGNPNVVTITDLKSTDDAVATIDLGTNTFKFYDTVYTSLRVDSNGRIILGTEESEYLNTDLTSEQSTPGIIAPFWDDLNTESDVANSDSAEDDLILYKIEGDRLIIEWNNVHFYDGGDTTDGITFQAILQLNTGQTNGNIIFNYPDLTEQELEDNNGTSATIGIKAPGNQTTSSFDRTLVSFNQTNPLVGASKAILFTPTTIDPNIPKITSGTAVTVAENSTQAVYTVTATAPQGATLTYGLSGADANLFNIDSTTGAVTFKTPPNFESPIDSGANNVYDIDVIANNGNLSDTRQVAITVTDLNEAPPTNTQYIANATTYENLDLIPGQGYAMTITDLKSTDDAVATIDLGTNNFKFYDTVYTSLKVDSNGRIILGTGNSEYDNTNLTSNEYTPGIIAPFWDDLNTASDVANADSAEDNLVLYQIKGDRLIIEWNNVHFYDGGDTTDGITFQAILQLNTGQTNGNIIFNYPDLTEQELEDNNGTSATIGIKAPGNQTTSSFDRTLVSFNQTNPLVGASKAILFTPNTINPNIPDITSGTAVTVAENSTQAVYTVTATVPQEATLTYSLSGTDADLFNINTTTGTVTFKTAPDFESPIDSNKNNVYEINVIASNGTLSSTPQAVAITVTDVNEAPTDLALSSTSVNENVVANTVIGTFTSTDPDKDNNFIYSLVAGIGDTDNSAFTIAENKLQINASPDFETKPNYKIRVRTTDNGTLFYEKELALAINDVKEISLTHLSDDILKIKGDGAKAKLQVTVMEHGSNLVNELGVFTVDDAKGTINGIAPGVTGYTQAVLKRAKVILSAIANDPNGFNSNNFTSILEFNAEDLLRFYLVKNSTSDAVLTGITSTTDVLFSDSSNQKLTDLGADGFSLAWKNSVDNTPEFKDLVVKVQPTSQSLPLGTNLQGNLQGEVLDLRDIKQQVKADFIVYREAAFNNFIGFYKVTDENGGIDTNDDGKADILTGQAGYTEAAIRGRVAGIDLTVNNQGTASYTGTFQPGSIFAPFIIVNGRPDALLDSNPNNDPAVYFPYLGANSDKADHIRLLGNNVFGFEDLANGGDRDFNDAIVRINLSAM